jgi:hypothetical protein
MSLIMEVTGAFVFRTSFNFKGNNDHVLKYYSMNPCRTRWAHMMGVIGFLLKYFTVVRAIDTIFDHCINFAWFFQLQCFHLVGSSVVRASVARLLTLNDRSAAC